MELRYFLKNFFKPSAHSARDDAKKISVCITVVRVLETQAPDRKRPHIRLVEEIIDISIGKFVCLNSFQEERDKALITMYLHFGGHIRSG